MGFLSLTWSLLDSGGRRAALWMVLLAFLAAIAEASGLGLAVPAIALIADPAMLQRVPWILSVVPKLGSMDHKALSVVFATALAGAFLLRTLFLGFVAWQQAAFVGTFQAALSERLFRQYLLQPWSFHLARNSAILIRNATSESMEVVLAVNSQIVILSEGFLLAGLLALLMAFEPMIALVVVLVIGLIAIAFQRFAKDRVRRWGELRQAEFGSRNQQFMQGIGAAKELILLGRWEYFARRFGAHASSIARLGTKAAFVAQSPKMILELVAVLSLASIAVTFALRGQPAERAVLVLGLFAAVAVRSLPSLNRILASLQQLNYANSALRTLSRELAMPVQSPSRLDSPSSASFESLELQDVTFRFPSAMSDALKRVNMSVRAGTCIGIIGASGAGKSTLVDVLLGLLAPTSGRVLVNGCDIAKNPAAWQRSVGYIPQSIYLSDDTLRRNIAFGVADESIDEAALGRAVSAAQLDEFVRSLPDGLDTIVGERGARLSGGQRQRIGIARALYNDPPVLVMDEATSALDNATEREVMQAINGLRGSKTILIVAHRLSTLKGCDSVIEVAAGSIVRSGTFDSVAGAADGNVRGSVD